jgi:tRNA pseudouridine38-40 synthase
MRFRLGIEYEGTEYHGWQFQTGQRTIQGEIEQALHVVLKEKITVVAAGRTDTGVHARGQIAHFDSEQVINCGKLERSLNGVLSRDIRISEIVPIDFSFHARYSARQREYGYYIIRKPSALLRRFSWFVSSPLDITRMQMAAADLLGKRNFKSFCHTDSGVENFECTVVEAGWLEKENLLLFTIKADRFLYGMVRAIVGTLVEIGRGVRDCAELSAILKAQDRKRAGQAAPARGLILERVYY